ncbi:hypothetical protein [Commensalibacter communis]|uniref:hypothetical protein n=1 Tax=Commensalibacter communis TaxID=2972786 RepID=UPI00232DD703|nr:hypothetical protein [Commensalibacter communis]
MDPLKFGERFGSLYHTNPEPSLILYKEGVETVRVVPKGYILGQRDSPAYKHCVLSQWR